jgi:hypothetical protein
MAALTPRAPHRPPHGSPLTSSATPTAQHGTGFAFPPMQQALPWIIALAVLVVIVAAMAFWVSRPRQATAVPLPSDWTISPRAVFSVDERRAYRQLRDAFPQYIVLAKLPLIRFCQPADPKEIHYWFELLGAIHVSFAVCSAHGRVLATIDLDGERPPARRTQQIKQSVLAACRIRYLRCAVEHLPSQTELQMLLPPGGAAGGFGPAAQPVVNAPGHGAEPVRGAAEQIGRRATDAATRDTVPASLVADRSVYTEPAAPVVRRASPPAAPAAPEASPSNVPAPAPGARQADSRLRKERKALWQDSGLFQDSFFGIDNLRDAGPQSTLGGLLREGRGAPSGQAEPGMLESERLKNQQKPR